MNIIFASRLVAYKNLDFVFNAIASMKARRLWPEGAVFVVMGRGPEEANLGALRGNLGLENEVNMLGSVSEERVKRETENCVLALAPALTEFSPNYVLRAIAHGKPFLISAEHGLSFEVPEEFIFDPCDQAQFIAKLSWILKHPKEALKLTKGLDSTTTWDEVVQRNVELVRSLVQP